MIDRTACTRAVLAALVAAAATGCAPDHLDRRPANSIVVAPVSGAGPVRFYARNPHRGHLPPAPPPAPYVAVFDSIAPDLRARIGSHQRERVLVSLLDTVAVRPFPAPPTGHTVSVLSTEIADLQNRRQAVYHAFQDSLPDFNAVRDTTARPFWICQAMIVELPLDSLPLLFRMPLVTYVESLRPHAPPPDCSPQALDQSVTIAAGRQVVATDSWRALALPAHRIGLLDTGVRASHALLARPNVLGLVENCLGCDPLTDHCVNDDAGDVSTPHGHGTANAAILSGNTNWCDMESGITAAVLDCFTVYVPCGTGTDCSAPECDPDPDLKAAACGIQDAIAAGDAVIVAELQPTGNEASALCRAADHAYDVGRLVVAAAGNNGPDGAVASPARARKVVAVGARHVSAGCSSPDQSRGRTSDHRYKPDVQGPTGTLSAGSCSDTDINGIGHTSGATPYVAGAASLVWDWLEVKAGRKIEPGQVCAALIACGGESALDATPQSLVRGAGLVHLPVDGLLAFDHEVLGDGDTKDVQVPLDDPDVRFLDVALWWPENQETGPHNTLLDTHSTVLLHVIDPNGNRAGDSVRDTGVFQKVRVTLNGPTAGKWTLHLEAPSVRRPPQTVYWCVVARHSEPTEASPADGSKCPN